MAINKDTKIDEDLLNDVNKIISAVRRKENYNSIAIDQSDVELLADFARSWVKILETHNASNCTRDTLLYCLDDQINRFSIIRQYAVYKSTQGFQVTVADIKEDVVTMYLLGDSSHGQKGALVDVHSSAFLSEFTLVSG